MMGKLDQWIVDKFADIAAKLPTLVHTEPASFACGYNTGYKQCLLDLERFFQAQEDLPQEFKDVYFNNKWELYE